MGEGLKGRGVALVLLLLVHAVLTSPLVKRDLSDVSRTSIVDGASPIQSELLTEDVFGGQVGEGSGAREKRLFKLKALGIGAGIKAVGAGVKAVGVSAAKAVGKKAVKAAVTVGATVAKAAITVGIAKILLSLVFGKINQLIDFKTRLLNGGKGGGGGLFGSSNLSSLSSSSGSSSGGGHGGATAGASFGGDASADGSYGGDIPVTTEAVSSVHFYPPEQAGYVDLPEIDPDKVSLQVPGEIIEGGFNVVNKAAPVVGEVIQRTAERVVRLVGGLKPILGASVGFKTSFKRQTSSTEDPFLELEHRDQDEAASVKEEDSAAKVEEDKKVEEKKEQ